MSMKLGGFVAPYCCSALLTHWCSALAIKSPSAPILKNDVQEAHLREESPMQKASRSQRKCISSSLPLSSAAFSSQLIWDLLSVCVQSQHGGFGKEKQPCTGIKKEPPPPTPSEYKKILESVEKGVINILCRHAFPAAALIKTDLQSIALTNC